MQQKIEWAQGTIAYQKYGHGTPVLLLHGFGEDSHIWQPQIEDLKSSCQLIIPDLPGTNDSIWQYHEHSSIDDMAEGIHQLLQAEGVSSCYMLGHSMGGYITLAYAEKYPEQLKGFGLIHSTAFADTEEKKENRLRGIALMETYGGWSFLKTTIPNLFGDSFKQAHPETIEWMIRDAAKYPTPVLQAYYRAMMNRPDRRNILKDNPLPVLFVIGTADVAAPMQDVLQQTHLPLKSYIHILTGIGHMGQLEATAELNGYLQSFIHQ